MKDFFTLIMNWLKGTPIHPVIQQASVPVAIIPPPTPAYVWSPALLAQHSVRLICDEEGLDLEQKNTMDATIHAESGYNLHAINRNYDFHADGTKYLSSTDFGICQWNDYFHGKEITPHEAENNPEKAVRLMCQYWKRGQRNQWCAYTNKSYTRFLA